MFRAMYYCGIGVVLLASISVASAQQQTSPSQVGVQAIGNVVALTEALDAALKQVGELQKELADLKAKEPKK
jgi:hypothetical protein